jgi:epoxide hydrolase-like predicted phosphatase
MINAVIFDLGGVILRTVDPGPRQALAARLGVSLHDLYYQVFSSDPARLATLGKISTTDHWEAVRAYFHMAPEELPGAIQQFWAGDRLDSSLVGSIRSLHRRTKTALLSNAWDNLRSLMENEWKIADAFDELVISAEVGLMKPDHRIYLLALERLGVEPEEAVFVDDVGENVDAARWVGLRGVQFRTRQQAMSELKGILDEGS